ncbi:MAG: response regulator transcription factor [Arenicella sp.]|nr:response regulator transcription factor [Arenicella sp.]
MNIILVDDHPLFREGLKAMLETESSYAVIKQFDSTTTLRASVIELQPDMVILDYRMPGGGALESLQFIKSRFPDIKVILLTGVEVSSLFQQFFELNADGILIKDASTNEMLESIKSVAAGHRIIAPAVQQQLDNSDSQLTTREFQVMVLILQGLNNTAIAKALSLSIRTIGNHRFSLMQKLELKNSVELMHYAIKNGLIEINQS